MHRLVSGEELVSPKVTVQVPRVVCAAAIDVRLPVIVPTPGIAAVAVLLRLVPLRLAIAVLVAFLTAMTIKQLTQSLRPTVGEVPGIVTFFVVTVVRAHFFLLLY